MIQKASLTIGAAFLLIVLHRLSLLGVGALSLGDERRYLSVLFFIQDLVLPGNQQLVLSQTLNELHGRPGAFILWLIPATVQVLFSGVAGHPLDSPTALLIPQLWNLIISLLVLREFRYWAAKLVPGNDIACALLLIAYAYFPSSYEFLRHFVPYEGSLLFFLWSIRLVFSRGETATDKKLLLSGALGGLSFSMYPGFYWFPVILVIFPLIFAARADKLRCLMLTCGGIFTPLMVFEFISASGRISYTDRLHALSHTITQGSFEEGFSFPFKYFWELGGISGILVLSAMVLFPLALPPDEKRREILVPAVVTALLAGGVIFHAILSAGFHSMVFYGRLLLPTVFFGFLGIAFLSARFFNGKKSLLVISLFGLLIAIEARTHFLSYMTVSYPRDILWTHPQLGNDSCQRESEVEWCEHVRQGGMTVLQGPPSELGCGYILTNFCRYFPVESAREAEDRKSHHYILLEQHFLRFTPYLYEVYQIEERELLRKAKLSLKVRKESENPVR